MNESAFGVLDGWREVSGSSGLPRTTRHHQPGQQFAGFVYGFSRRSGFLSGAWQKKAPPDLSMKSSWYRPSGFAKTLSLLAGLFFLQVAASRRLNFDEWLVLRSGWLLASGEESSLHFLMPYTWVVGVLTQHLSDAEVLITGMRLAAVVGLSGLLWQVLVLATDKPGARWITLLVCLANGIFFTHAFEIRYDLVVLASWLAAFSLLWRPAGRRTFFLLGVITLLLALHHVKGIYYAAFLVMLVLASRFPDRRQSAEFVLGALCVAGVWGGVLYSQGLFAEQWAIYLQFGTLALTGEAGHKFVSFFSQAHVDLAWWLFVIFMSGVGLRALPGVRERILLGGFGLAPLLFVILHPHPWGYLLVPAVPFFAVLATRGFGALRPGFGQLAGGVVSVSLVLFTGALLYKNFVHALGDTKAADVSTLALLARHSLPGDTVADPAGAAYFVRPNEPEWYLDTLFLPAARQGAWMKATQNTPSTPTFWVASYRADWLTDLAGAGYRDSHTRVCNWLWLKRGDARIAPMQRDCRDERTNRLKNHWMNP